MTKHEQLTELAEMLGCGKPAVKVYMRELFPGLAWMKVNPDSLRESISQKKKELYDNIIRLVKSGQCSTHSHIAAGLGISDRLLIHLLGGHMFTMRTFDESEKEEVETRVIWPHAGVSMHKGKLEILPPKETSKRGTLLSYPAGAPLERGVRP
jgi:hypothetical protein